MANHIRSKTAEEAEFEKWRLDPIGKKAELSIEGEAICNIMGQHDRYILERLIALEKKVAALDKASHAE